MPNSGADTRSFAPEASGHNDRMSRGSPAVVAANDAGYLVAPDGSVISPQGRALRLRIDTCGYPCFSYRKVPVRVHRLAALQRYGEAIFEPGIEVRHRDGVRANSRPDNLLLGTRRDNSLDRQPLARRRHGQHAQDGLRRLTQEEADDARAKRAAGWTYGRIADHYGVNVGTIWFIVKQRTYVDLEREEASCA